MTKYESGVVTQPLYGYQKPSEGDITVTFTGEVNVTPVEIKESLEEGKSEPHLLDYLFSDGTFGPDLVDDKTPVGICVAPASHFADGKSRFMSLKLMTTRSTGGTTSHQPIYWRDGDKNYVAIDLPLTNYNEVITINSDGTARGTQSEGNLPADESYSFNKSWNGMLYLNYTTDDIHCPSPFLSDGESKNDVYFTSGQALADIDGSSNTSTILKADGTKYLAAKACRSFNPGTHSGEWYLPAMGELGYVMVQWKAIDDKILAAGSSNGARLSVSGHYWSSTEYDSDKAWYLSTGRGTVEPYGKGIYEADVRAFLALDVSNDNL